MITRYVMLTIATITFIAPLAAYDIVLFCKEKRDAKIERDQRIRRRNGAKPGQLSKPKRERGSRQDAAELLDHEVQEHYQDQMGDE